MSLQLVLLDRDGVINFDSPDYIKSPQEWHPIPGALEAIARLQQTFKVAVCTNQSGVGRGLFDEETLAAIHDKLNRQLIAAGGQALDIFYCPHQPDAQCPCRKPSPALLDQAMHCYAIGAAETLYAGDSAKDLLAAAHAGCRAALVLTGNGSRTVQSDEAALARYTCDSLAALPACLNAAF